MKERRRFVRIKEDDEINYCIIPEYKSSQQLTKDLSLGGIRFFAGNFIPLRAVLKVTIKLKHERKVINAVVRVVWLKTVFDDERYDAGAEFVEISNEDLKFLEQYLTKVIRS